MSHPETMRVVSDNPAHNDGFIVINRDDFDPETMKEYQEPAKVESQPVQSKKRGN